MVYAKPVDECTVFILDYQAAKDIFERFQDSETENFHNEANRKYDIIVQKSKGVKPQIMAQENMNNAIEDDDEVEDNNSQPSDKPNIKSKKCQTVSKVVIVGSIWK